jgi:putative redox protein
LGSRVDPNTTGPLPDEPAGSKGPWRPSGVLHPHGHRRVEATWLGGFLVEMNVRQGRFRLSSDERPEDGWTDTAPMPSEYLFASVASCFAMAVAWAARKRRIELPDLQVIVSGVHDYPERRYESIEISAVSSLAVSAPAEFERLVHLAEDVCWITRSIVPGIGLKVSAVVPGTEEPDDHGS